MTNKSTDDDNELMLFLKNKKANAPHFEKGFTLVELLVVITIIAIISTVAIVVYGNIQADARDAKRKSELETIATVLEVNKSAAGGNYNPLLASMFGGLVFPGGVTSEALDPQGYPYCIAMSSNTFTPAILPANLSGVSGWVNTPGMTDCPATPTGWSKLSGTEPPTSTVSWTICTRLENQSTPMAYCRTNSQ